MNSTLSLLRNGVKKKREGRGGWQLSVVGNR